MAEWSNAAVLKTVDLQGSGGSNPSLSATKKGVKTTPFLFFKVIFAFLLIKNGIIFDLLFIYKESFYKNKGRTYIALPLF